MVEKGSKVKVTITPRGESSSAVPAVKPAGSAVAEKAGPSAIDLAMEMQKKYVDDLQLSIKHLHESMAAVQNLEAPADGREHVDQNTGHANEVKNVKWWH